MIGLRFRVCRLDELVDGEIRGFAVEGMLDPVLLVRDGDRLHATASMCPHGDVSLVDGELVSGQIVCPGHRYAFDLTTGRCAHDGRMRLARFEIEIVGEEVYVSLGRRSA